MDKKQEILLVEITEKIFEIFNQFPGSVFTIDAIIYQLTIVHGLQFKGIHTPYNSVKNFLQVNANTFKKVIVYINSTDSIQAYTLI